MSIRRPELPKLKLPKLDVPPGTSVGRLGQMAGTYITGHLFGTGRRSYEEIKAGEPFIVCEGVVKIYKVADLEVFALQGLDLIVTRGEMMAIIGNSGCGKSTLLNILGGLDYPSAGRATVGGRDLGKLTSADQVRYKREVVGFVWQNTGRNLIPYLSAFENVLLPLALAGRATAENRAWAKDLLETVGLADRMHHKLTQLSGGQQQRVAIAIGLINRPPLLLADEPTGSVDTANAQLIMDVFRRVNQTFGTTIVIVTHDQAVARMVERFIAMRDGKTSTETIRRVAELDAEQARATAVEETHDQYVVLDSAGRLQVPRDFLDKLGVKDRRVVIEMEGDTIKIVAPRQSSDEGRTETTS